MRGPDVQEDRRHTRVLDRRHRLRHRFRRHRLAERFDMQPGGHDHRHPVGKRAVIARNAEGFYAMALIERRAVELPFVDIAVDAPEIVGNLDGARRTVHATQGLAHRRHETGMQDRKLQEAAGFQHA